MLRKRAASVVHGRREARPLLPRLVVGCYPCPCAKLPQSDRGIGIVLPIELGGQQLRVGHQEFRARQCDVSAATRGMASDPKKSQPYAKLRICTPRVMVPLKAMGTNFASNAIIQAPGCRGVVNATCVRCLISLKLRPERYS